MSVSSNCPVAHRAAKLTLSCVDSELDTALFQSRHGFLASLNSNSLDEASFWMTVAPFDKEEEQEASLTEVIVRG